MKNIGSVDLNLLVVFRALCREKNTVRAAKSLHLSQPAVSHALARLRLLFDDPLFVRASKGLLPTARSLKLQGKVEALLENAEALLSSPKEFDPLTATVTFRIATTDYFEQIFFPKLLRRLQIDAPGITIVSRPAGGELPKEKMESGSLDLAIAGFYRDLPSRFFKQSLYSDDFVCLANSKTIRGAMTLQKYGEAQHLLISPQGDLESRARFMMKSKGYDIHYRAGVSSFISPAAIVAQTELLLTCPRKLARSFVDYYPVKIYELPIDLSRISVQQIWHERLNNDEPHRWLRATLREICTEL